MESLRYAVTLRLCTLILLANHTTGAANAETLEGGVGISSIAVVSSRYASHNSSSPELQAAYTHALEGRWSIVGRYQMTSDQSLSGISAGVAFDSTQLHTTSGRINIDGQPEIRQSPTWLFRYSAAVGIFRYSDTLRSTNARLGNKNEVSVQAELYGFNLSAATYRFFNDSIGVSGQLSQVIASANNFGITATSLTVGLIWQYN